MVRILGLISILLICARADGATMVVNSEMTAIFSADQKDREKGIEIDWSVVGPADAARRLRTQQLLDQGALQSGDDYFHAAYVFQHGQDPDDFLKSHLLAMVAVARGKSEATWIASASLDRYLQNIGRPQVLGTQYKFEGGKVTQQPYASSLISDSLRSALGVPPISQQEERRKQFEKDAAQKNAGAPLPPTPATTTGPAKVDTWQGQPDQISCAPISGADTLIKRQNLQWIVVGEVPGTQETPAAFTDLVCNLSARHPVTVGVAIPAMAQSDIDAFIGSDGSDAAKKAFQRSMIWNQPIKDGFSSEAYFRMFERLRELRAAHRVRAVIAFQAPVQGPVQNPGAFQKAYAQALSSQTSPDGLTVVLVGMFSARLTAPSGGDPNNVPMAGLLPVEKTITLEALGYGGSFWGCSAPTDCGVKSLPAPAQKAPRGITLYGAGRDFSGSLSVGSTFSSSSPLMQK